MYYGPTQRLPSTSSMYVYAHSYSFSLSSLLGGPAVCITGVIGSFTSVLVVATMLETAVEVLVNLLLTSPGPPSRTRLT